ncbi:MAG: Uma2 family endonuclease [Gloeocapsa sp. UFS-A4-WI-NPMV-4B04]|jgi:Uma2 family endonuclease|nr:Uma2 family endonuclease [Gloeocapsa sp. UFS-A4-WI-NPMV-4B04]
MTVSPNQISTEFEYPDADGKPMAESDQAREYLTYTAKVLRIYFQDRLDVYVSGNLFIYYEKGNPRAVVAPDVFVVFGVNKGDRRSYKTWEEGNRAPDFVLEITSKSTQKEDQEIKPNIYAALGVREYFQYDPTGDYLNPQLQGSCLVEGNYQPIAATMLPNDVLSLSSEVLGLELRLQSGKLRFLDPATGEMLLTHEEQVQKAHSLAAKLRELGIDPDQL